MTDGEPRVQVLSHRSLGVRPGVIRRRVPDVEVQRLLVQLSPAKLRRSLSVSRLRRDWQLCVKAFATRDRVADVRSVTTDQDGHPIRLRIYEGTGVADPKPIIVWFHGGGFVVGDLYTAGATCRAIARRTGALVVAVQYRLVPEHSLETQIDDCHTATEWVSAHASEIGGDPGRISVGGDSAGGMLAALAAHGRDGHPPPSVQAQILIYPATDLTRRYDRQALDALLPFTPMHAKWLRAKVGSVSSLGNRRFSPLHSTRLTHAPPTIVVTAGFDPLCPEALDYASRLVDNGVPVQVFHYPGQFHGFVSFDRVLHGATDALDRVCATATAVVDDTPIVTSVTSVTISARRSARRASWLRPDQRWNELQVGYLLAADLVRGRRTVSTIEPARDRVPTPTAPSSQLESVSAHFHTITEPSTASPHERTDDVPLDAGRRHGAQ